MNQSSSSSSSGSGSSVYTSEKPHSFSYRNEILKLNEDESIDYYARISPPVDPVLSFSTLSVESYFDTKWRSISLTSQLFSSAYKSRRYEHNVKGKNINDQTIPYEISHQKQSYVVELIPNTLRDEIKAPGLPFLLLSSHFETCIPKINVTESVEYTFNQFPEISYEFVEEKCMWNAVYLRGSSHCKIQIKIYSHGLNHVVEGNRLLGDGAAFRIIFAEIKSNILIKYIDEKAFNSFNLNSPLPLSKSVTDSESQLAMMNVLKMARSGKIEAQLEAARILCDLSLHDDMQQLICDSGCLKSLVEDLLPLKNCDWTRQHALLALANLSEAISCQSAMIDAGILTALLTLAIDGPYETAEISRESARILANLSSSMAIRVVHVLGAQAVAVWLTSVDNFQDERLKLHACRAKGYLILVTN